MAKDPAFLFYPKDWLQGTSQLMPEEKGVYIDLLAHQHQEQDLPNDTKRLARMTGLPESEFLKVWETLQHKFLVTDNNRLVNRKLDQITTERETKSHTNKITGIFASIVRLSPASLETKEKIKKTFKTEDFLSVSATELTERLTIWWAERLKSIGNGNGNTFKRGCGGKPIKGKMVDKENSVLIFDDETSRPLTEEELFLISKRQFDPTHYIKPTEDVLR